MQRRNHNRIQYFGKKCPNCLYDNDFKFVYGSNLTVTVRYMRHISHYSYLHVQSSGPANISKSNGRQVKNTQKTSDVICECSLKANGSTKSKRAKIPTVPICSTGPSLVSSICSCIMHMNSSFYIHKQVKNVRVHICIWFVLRFFKWLSTREDLMDIVENNQAAMYCGR